MNFNGNRFENPRYDPNRKGRNARHQFTAYLGITGYPTVAFFDENANYIAPIVGYHNVQQMEFYLKLFNEKNQISLHKLSNQFIQDLLTKELDITVQLSYFLFRSFVKYDSLSILEKEGFVIDPDGIRVMSFKI